MHNDGAPALSPSKSCLKGVGAKRQHLDKDADEGQGTGESVDSLLEDIRKEFNAGLKQTENDVIKVVEKHAGAVNKRIDGLDD